MKTRPHNPPIPIAAIELARAPDQRDRPAAPATIGHLVEVAAVVLLAALVLLS